MNALEKLSIFFKHYNLFPDLELIIELIHSNILFNRMLTFFLRQYQSQIIIVEMDKVTTDSFLFLIVEAYCITNKVEIAELDDSSEEVYEYDDKVLDSFEVFKEIKKYPLLTVEQEREREIIKLRFGFVDGRVHTEEVGKKFNLSGSRIGQIEAKALSHIRNLKGTETLAVYIDHLEASLQKLHDKKLEEEKTPKPKEEPSLGIFVNEKKEIPKEKVSMGLCRKSER